jgi:hypothetical protein
MWDLNWLRELFAYDLFGSSYYGTNQASKRCNLLCSPVHDCGPKPQPPGVEFLGAVTDVKKTTARRFETLRRPIPKWTAAKSSKKAPERGPCWKRAVCEDWVAETAGLELVTHHRVIEQSPVSAGNGISDRRDRGEIPPFRQRRLTTETLTDTKNPIPAQWYAKGERSLSLGDWVMEVVGHKLVTHQPGIEPVSAQRRERTFKRQRQRLKMPLFAR